MLRKIGFSLLMICSLISTSAFATTEHIFTQSLSVEYDLPVNDPQVFSNIFFWTIKANCLIFSENSENHLTVKMLRKTGTVNAMQLASGDLVELTVQSGEKINITAESGAKVELVNIGDKVIKATCSSAY